MPFTAGDVFRRTLLLAPELKAKPPSRMVVAELFTDALAELVADVVAMDPERLAGRYEVPEWALESDPIDLAVVGEEPGEEEEPERREWLNIVYLDALRGARWVEVTVLPIEARHQADNYHGSVFCYLSERMEHAHKVAGWGSVTGLRIYGTPAPEPVDPADLESVRYAYPKLVEAALRWELLVVMASHAGLAGTRAEYWEGKRREARERLLGDADDHVESRQSAIVPQLEW